MARRSPGFFKVFALGLLAPLGCGDAPASSNLSANAASKPEMLAKAKADAARAEDQARKAEAASLKRPLEIEDAARPETK